ncbi:ATPase involved in chromosome partitioning [Terriglobus roseus DSM 18391]|uniref:ATPase involved in chromosome partitioning n=1 Tax=Terriglobus roseus (strain DSM 18391 / NRRL B-41598 / KBS 63) TaxID=926566 RepID=I3ZES1_TERRK|nr:cellulose synthase operon protein YhjQ/BcsQ [Terriglobus roseus]AFL87739.1 ATPase involved in chromosome partitioning [Terriglobus roseus DSM 18391]
MDEFATNPKEDGELAQTPETPEDVAVLYTWANVHGGKYRDFSASRREYRAQQRHRMVEAQRQVELEAARELEEKAEKELEAARLLESKTDEAGVSPEAAEKIRGAEQRAEQERLAAKKHVETAEELRLALEQAEREMEEARRRAEEQSARYAEADARWRAQQRGMADVVPGEIADPYYYAGPLEPGAFAPGKGVRSSVPQRVSSERKIAESYYRARGESGAEIDARREESRRSDEGIGMFATGGGHHGRPSAGGRSIYRETEPAMEVRPETPKDMQQNAVAPGDKHILPRNPDPRSSAESDGRRVARSEDSDSGSMQTMEQSSRGRRREGVTDMQARTTRHPRTSDESYLAESYGERARQDSEAESGDRFDYPSAPAPSPSYDPEDARAVRHDASRLPDREGPAPRATRTHYDDRPQPTTAAHARSSGDYSGGREERPAWLGREARAADKLAEQVSRDDENREIEGRRRERDAFERFLARSTDVTPRSTNDRPARSAYLERNDERDDRSGARADTRPTPDREGLREDHEDRQNGRVYRESTEERGREEAAERRREDRSSRSAAGGMGEVPSSLPDDGELNPRPLSERPSVDKLPPLRDLTPMRDLPPMRDLAPMRDRSGYREEGDEASSVRHTASEISAAPRERASVREVAMKPVPQRDAAAASGADDRADLGPAVEGEWPRVERRRYERSSVSRGIPSLLDSSREYRAAARAADLEEKNDRTRARYAQRDEQAREDLREYGQSQSPGESALRDREDRSGGRALPESDTLQQSRERVAARWFALKGLMGSNVEPIADPPPQIRTSSETDAPMLSIVALAGGVGKTSLVATLGRALSSAGEKVLLADTTSHGLLPYYFGARELRPDVVRTFSPPPGSPDATVYMVNYETDRLAADDAGQAHLVEEISRHSKGTQRVLLDLNGSSAWLARRLAKLNSRVLVPIAPDMNSVLSIRSVERFFAGTQDSEGQPVSPYYVLNQFDASLPLHLDVREVLRQQLGNRLLPVMIRRSQSVAEALAEGMTVIDYAPESPVTEDYIHLAEWVRNLAAPARVGIRRIRWSER